MKYILHQLLRECSQQRGSPLKYGDSSTGPDLMSVPIVLESLAAECLPPVQMPVSLCGSLCTEYLWCSCGLPSVASKCAHFHMGCFRWPHLLLPNCLSQRGAAFLQASAWILFDVVTGRADPCLPGLFELRLTHPLFCVAPGESTKMNYVTPHPRRGDTGLSRGLGLMCSFAH